MSSQDPSAIAPDADADQETGAQERASFGFQDVPAGEKAGMVRGVFDRVAERYDLMNDLMSGGVHRIWKDLAVTRANPQPGERLIDIAGGTGDIARRWVTRSARAGRRRSAASGDAVIVDVNAQMLSAGRARSADADYISWVCGDAEKLPLPDRVGDAAMIAFGIRNVTDRAAALAEARRVLKPGGRFLSLEFSRPATSVLEAVYERWSFDVIPKIGGWVAGDPEPYQYLVESIRRFPQQEEFSAELRQSGFENVSYTNYSGGVAALHVGWRL